jgi:biopolymer transport protein ExbD
MIDVVFQLLIFFLWTSSFRAVEHVLPSAVAEQTGSLPSSMTLPPPEADFADVVLRIRWLAGAPSWQVNDREWPNIDALRQHLVEIRAVHAGAAVIVHPDPDTPLQHVIDAYDATRLAGFHQVRFAVAAADEAPP